MNTHAMPTSKFGWQSKNQTQSTIRRGSRANETLHQVLGSWLEISRLTERSQAKLMNNIIISSTE